ncbi:hypothetical protein VE00_10743 [Pseudogymnoascus sp. WSF 3629]|nr:hypothetical protein VE00_10743 [Pseudogymnoascus sp. WSF 3629]
MAGHDIDAAHKLETCINEKREIVSLEIAKLQEIKFAAGMSCQLCAVPQETCHDSMYFTRQSEGRCLYDGVVREAVAAIMVAGPDVVVEKIKKLVRDRGVKKADFEDDEDDDDSEQHEIPDDLAASHTTKTAENYGVTINVLKRLTAESLEILVRSATGGISS